MMGKTHAKGGQVAALGGYLWLQNSGVMSQVPVPGYVGLLIIYPFAVWASTAPDLDHGKNSTPSHDVVSKAIWYVLHATTNLRKGMRPKVWFIPCWVCLIASIEVGRLIPMRL